MPNCLVVVGPIASGKSTVSRELGARLRSAGRQVVVVDLDDVALMAGGYHVLSGEQFRHVLVVYGQLVGAWLHHGFDVIAHGPFFQRHEQEAIVDELPPGVVLRRVQLHATFEVALERVRNDPEGRVMSRDEDFLRGTYERVEEMVHDMPPADWSFDSVATGWDAIVDQLFEKLSVGA